MAAGGARKSAAKSAAEKAAEKAARAEIKELERVKAEEEALEQDLLGHVLTFDEIDEADDLPTKLVAIPEWGGAVRIQAMSLNKYLEVQRKVTELGDYGQLPLMMIQACLIEPVVNDEQIQALADKSIPATSRILNEIGELSPGVRSEVAAAARRTFRPS